MEGITPDLRQFRWKEAFCWMDRGSHSPGGRKKSESAFSSCCWSLAFAKHSHRFPFFIFSLFLLPAPSIFFSVWVTALRTAQKRGLNFWGKKGSCGRMNQPESLLWARNLWRGLITLARSIWLLISECGVLASACRPWETNVCRREFHAWLDSYFCVHGNTQLRTVRPAPSTGHTRQLSLQQSRGSCSWGLLAFPPSSASYFPPICSPPALPLQQDHKPAAVTIACTQKKEAKKGGKTCS